MKGSRPSFAKRTGNFPASHLWLEAGYRGEDKGKDWVEKELGWRVDLVERPRQAAPKDVLMAWAREWAKEGVKVDWQNLMPPNPDYSRK